MAINAFTYASQLDCFDRSPVYARNTDMDSSEEPEPPETQDGGVNPLFEAMPTLDMAFSFYPFEAPELTGGAIYGSHAEMFSYDWMRNNTAKYAGYMVADDPAHYFTTSYFEQFKTALHAKEFTDAEKTWLTRKAFPRAITPYRYALSRVTMACSSFFGSVQYQRPSATHGWGWVPRCEDDPAERPANQMKPLRYGMNYPSVIKAWLPKDVYDSDGNKIPHWQHDATVTVTVKRNLSYGASTVFLPSSLTDKVWQYAPPTAGTMKFYVLYARMPITAPKTFTDLIALPWVKSFEWTEELNGKIDATDTTTVKTMTAHLEKIWNRFMLFMIVPAWLWDSSISEITPREHTGFLYAGDISSAEKAKDFYVRNGMFEYAGYVAKAVAAETGTWSYVTKPFDVTDGQYTTTFKMPNLYLNFDCVLTPKIVK